MKSAFRYFVAVYFVAALAGCKPKSVENATPVNQSPAKVITSADLAAMANAVPSTGPREGNNYKVFFLVLRQDQRPAVGFEVYMNVKGKSAPLMVVTNESGLAQFDNLPFPDAKHPLMASLHYYKGAEDQPREITYPFLQTDAYRLKDIQYIPNTVTPSAVK